MSNTPLNIRRIDSRRDDIGEEMARLREKLSPRGDVVSQSGRQRTVEVFGEALSPGQVVERICRDVAEKGLAAVLDYTARIDKAQLAAETVRVPLAELERAHAGAERGFLAGDSPGAGEHPRISGGHIAPRRAGRDTRRIS